MRILTDEGPWTSQWGTVLVHGQVLVVEEADLIDPRPVDPEEER